ncbi:MAG TPA: ABC transporter substrate-binding protein [Candidatus Saccharimonadales bacterium]|nr:ABC transporter substrate-binding protein [Candidatus Saccharimonadales bacterium]
MANRSKSVALTIILSVLLLLVSNGFTQERRAKLRISNAGFTITALPLLAAKDWGLFSANGLDMEVILMQSSLVPAALTQGDIDFQAGVGPASVNATMTGFATRAIWFSSDRISYWLMAKPQFKTLENLKSKKVAITGLGGTVHVAFLLALEKLGVNPKDFVLVSIAGQQIQQLISLESGYVDAALLSPPVTLGAQKKGFYKVLDVGGMVDMPGGGLTALAKTIQERPAETKRVIRSLQQAKDEIRKSKPKTLDLIVKLLKMDKEAANETYDQFLTTLSPTGIPTRVGMDILVKSVQAQGRHVGRKVAFEEIADDRLATEVAKELGYKIP